LNKTALEAFMRVIIGKTSTCLENQPFPNQAVQEQF